MERIHPPIHPNQIGGGGWGVGAGYVKSLIAAAALKICCVALQHLIINRSDI
jgi:hypothetical protein